MTRYRRSRAKRNLTIAVLVIGVLGASKHQLIQTQLVKTTSAPVTTTAQAKTEQAYAQKLGGYSDGQEQCLNELWTEESGWSPYAANSQSDARGIPQNINGWSAYSPGDWKAQIAWGENYIDDRYHGDPCKAWTFERSHTPNWY